MAGGHNALDVDNVTGSIEVIGTDTNRIEVVVNKTIRAESQEKIALAEKEVTLDVTQQPGAVKLYVNGPFRCHCDDDCSGHRDDPGYSVKMDFQIRVPRNIDLTLKTVNSGHIQIGDVSGNYSIHNVNGTIDMTGVAGSGVAKSVNGHVRVLFRENPSANSDFGSVNGAIELYFQHNLAGDFRFKTFNGGVYSDFPVTALPVRAVEEQHEGGKSGISRGPLYRRTDRRGWAGDQDRNAKWRHSHFGEAMNKNIREFKLLRWSVPILAFLAAGALAVYAQNNTESGSDHVTVPLSDPSQPAMLKASLVNGGITVKGYDGKDIVVEARVRGGGEPARSEGNMKRIPISATGLTVEEENNQVRVGSDSVGRAIDLTISVPRQTSLTLRTVNDGDIVVSDVRGDLEVDDVNGAVTLNHISGSVIAHALNEGIKATFDHVAQKPMAFSSLNGKIDVTFPAGPARQFELALGHGRRL